MALVAGVDSSTQATKIVVRRAEDGALVRTGRAPHPDGTEVDPEAWWRAFEEASSGGLLEGVEAIAVAAQQHGLVAMDEDGRVVRPALLWNDTRAAGAAADLVAELGGPKAWADAVGSVPVSSFTVAKLRWLAANEPENASRVAEAMLPHDWLTRRITGAAQAVTDRGDASGTGYYSPAEGAYRDDLVRLAIGHGLRLPRVAAPGEALECAPAPGREGVRTAGVGTGDNMGAGLGLGLRPGDVVVSVGTSGTAFASVSAPTADASGLVSGFADAQGGFLPLVCTLNAARVLEAGAAALQVGREEFDRLVLSAEAGAEGLVLLPYLEGERTPNLPDATGRLDGITGANLRPANIARAFVEGMLCGLADAVDALADNGVPVERVLLIGGGARSEAVKALAPRVFGRPVLVPEDSEYVADGAARQAAWALLGGDEPPEWGTGAKTEERTGEPAPQVRERYAEVRARLESQQA